MSEVVEEQEAEPSDLEGNREEFFNCNEAKNKYARAFLLELAEVEICSKLPEDFDMLILRELDDASNDEEEQGRLPVNPSLCVTLQYPTLDVGLHGKRWDSRSSLLGKENQPHVNSPSAGLSSTAERSGILCCCTPEESKRSGETNPYRLTRTAKPYRPPHFRKDKSWLEAKTINAEILDANKATVAQKEVSRSDADRVTDNISFGEFGDLCCNTTPINHLHCPLQIKTGGSIFLGNHCISSLETRQSVPVGSMQKNGEVENEVPLSLGECESLRSNREGSEVFANANKDEISMIENNESEFDDMWSEIIKSLQLEESELKPKSNIYDTPDSEVGICLPDTDSLITTEDLMAPYISMDADKLTSNILADITNGSETLTLTKRKPDLQHSQPQTSHTLFAPQRPSLCPIIDQMNPLTKSMTSNNYNCFTYFNQPLPDASLNTLNINDSLVCYSLFDQPVVCSRPLGQVSRLDLHTMPTTQYSPFTLQRTTYQNFGMPRAGN